ncbi:hypothetical protein ACQPYE_18990 [Actinosynnema sp. CA-299493]
MTVRERPLPAHVGGGTRTWLVRRLWFLLGAAVLTLATAPWAVWAVADTAGTVRDRTTEAVLETAAARLALTAADRAVITSFASGHAALTGPGQDYTNRLAAANQSLAKVAEANQAAAGAGRLQVIAGLVAAYSGAVGQADAHYRVPEATGLGAADLWYASRLLHAPGGVLEQLETLQADQRAALAEQLDDGTLWPPLLWSQPASPLLPALFGLVLLAVQWQFFKRFRRVLNVWLAVATVLTLFVAVALLFTASQRQQLVQVGDRVDTLLAERQAAVSADEAVGQRALADLLSGLCGAQGCGPTVDEFRAGLPAQVTDVTNEHDTDAQEVTAQTRAATDSGGRGWLVPLAAVLAFVLVVIGMVRRLNEYRYRT